MGGGGGRVVNGLEGEASVTFDEVIFHVNVGNYGDGGNVEICKTVCAESIEGGRSGGGAEGRRGGGGGGGGEGGGRVDLYLPLPSTFLKLE